VPIRMTKAELLAVRVEERAKMRVKQKQSAFMRRTLSIYNGQNKRIEAANAGALPYTLAEFRSAAQRALDTGCCFYCGTKLTVRNLTPDHKVALAACGSWNLDNLAWCCQSCNWEKGRLSATEFQELLLFLDEHLSPASSADVKRRLSIGGKWSWK